MSVKQIHIEKYDFAEFEKENKPYAMILTDVIQRIPSHRMREAFLWIFLESLPPTWKVNKQHIMHHFGISDRTYERFMSYLNTVKLIEYRQNRCESGAFGTGTLVVLNGTNFSPDAECNGTVKIGDSVMNKKKTKVIHISEAHRDAKFGDSVKPSITRASKGPQTISPNRQKTEPRFHDAHINTTIKNNKEKKKTNKEPVSVFADADSVKTHLNLVIANRGLFVEDEIIDEIVFYVGSERAYDAVVKKINIALKLVREGRWNTPQNYKGISSQSIREKDEKEQIAKRELYRQEARAYQNISKVVSRGGSPRKLSEMLQQYRDGLNAQQKGMPEDAVSNRDPARRIA